MEELMNSEHSSAKQVGKTHKSLGFNCLGKKRSN